MFETDERSRKTISELHYNAERLNGDLLCVLSQWVSSQDTIVINKLSCEPQPTIPVLKMKKNLSWEIMMGLRNGYMVMAIDFNGDHRSFWRSNILYHASIINMNCPPVNPPLPAVIYPADFYVRCNNFKCKPTDIIEASLGDMLAFDYRLNQYQFYQNTIGPLENDLKLIRLFGKDDQPMRTTF